MVPTGTHAGLTRMTVNTYASHVRRSCQILYGFTEVTYAAPATAREQALQQPQATYAAPATANKQASQQTQVTYVAPATTKKTSLAAAPRGGPPLQ